MAMLLAVITGMIGAGCVDAEDKVGYINLQRLVNESEMGNTAREDLNKMRELKQAELTLKLQEINNLREALNNQASQMNDREKREKLEVIQKSYKAYQRLVADAKEDITREDKELVAIILEKADGILKRVTKRTNSPLFSRILMRSVT
jgi:outer membrane protein